MGNETGGKITQLQDTLKQCLKVAYVMANAYGVIMQYLEGRKENVGGITLSGENRICYKGRRICSDVNDIGKNGLWTLDDAVDFIKNKDMITKEMINFFVRFSDEMGSEVDKVDMAPLFSILL
jgi:hypothetical protein